MTEAALKQPCGWKAECGSQAPPDSGEHRPRSDWTIDWIYDRERWRTKRQAAIITS